VILKENKAALRKVIIFKIIVILQREKEIQA